MDVNYIVSKQDVTVKAAGNILDQRNNETGNIYGKNIFLSSSNGSIGTSAEDLNIYVNYLTSGGYLTAIAYNGIINLEQYEGNLDVNYIVSKQDVTVKAAGNILDQRDNETGNIYGKNIFLSSSNGSIGTSAEDLNIYVNYLTSGGYLTAAAYNGIINLEQYEGNLDVNYIVSKQDVTVKAAGNILDQRDNETGNIYGKNIFLSSSNGSIGTSAEDLNIYVNYLTSGGYLTAAAYNGIINLEQYEGNLDVNYIVSKQDVTVKAAGNILDQRNNETGNIYGKNIFLSSSNGSIGTSAEDLNIYVNYLTSGGYLTAIAYNGIINLEQYEGNLDVNYIVSKQDVTVKAAGNILDQRDNETGNIYGKNIFLSSNNGSIGTSAEDLNIYVNYLTSRGYLTAAAYNGIINLEQYEGNLDVNYIVSKQDVTVKAAGNILDQRNNETGNIYGKNIFLSSNNGSIGTSAEDLNMKYQLFHWMKPE